MIETIAYLIPGLACAGMMGVMMWMMRGRGDDDASPDDDRRRQVEALRAEIQMLDEPARSRPGGPG